MTATRVIIIVLAIALVVSAIWAFTKKQIPEPATQPAPQPATPAPEETQASSPAPGAGWSGDAVNFTYTGADGNTYTADQKFAGKPLVLNFWAAW